MWLRRLEADRDNVSAAIDWAARRDPEVAVRLSSALAYFWLIGRHRTEVRRRLADTVESARDAPPASRAKALVWAAQLGNVEGRLDEAVSQAREARELADSAGGPWLLALCEAVLGLTLGLGGEIVQAGELLDAAHARFGQAGDEWGTALAAMLSRLVSMLVTQHE